MSSLTLEEQENIKARIKAGDIEAKTKYRIIRQAVRDIDGNLVKDQLGKTLYDETLVLKQRKGNFKGNGVVGQPNSKTLTRCYVLSPNAFNNYNSLADGKRAKVLIKYLQGLTEFKIIPSGYFQYRKDKALNSPSITIRVPHEIISYLASLPEEIITSNVVSDFLELKLPILLDKFEEKIYSISPAEILEALGLRNE